MSLTVPWRTVTVAALLGTAAAVALVWLDVGRSGQGALALIQPGARGPSAGAIRADFSGAELPPGIGHDGQQFYAMARQPLAPRAAAQHLDRPRYRLQRPLLPWLAALLPPWSRGSGLVWDLFAVGVLSLLLGGLVTGALARSLGATPLAAAAFPLLPGSIISLRLSVADALALALALLAGLWLVRGRGIRATLVAVLAVLAKESAWLVLAGLALWRRDRAAILAVVAAAAVALGRAVWLGLAIPAEGPQIVELGLPGLGLVGAASHWLRGESLFGLTTVAALLLGAGALLRRGLSGLGWAVALQIGLVLLLSADALGLAANATRSSMPLMLLSLLHLLAHPPQGAGGPPGHTDGDQQGRLEAQQQGQSPQDQ